MGTSYLTPHRQRQRDGFLFLTHESHVDEIRSDERLRVPECRSMLSATRAYFCELEKVFFLFEQYCCYHHKSVTIKYWL